ncbi:MAG: hydantoinase/oxoprolinase family protein [Bacillota bacterium]|nr:hydantoinase/oxoprolinase family protein [Bacillota bacterium]
MAIVLGIDTGGTYTDGVIIDLDSRKILSATKASTTHRDLIVGIRNTINQLDYDNLDTLDYVALSTTLATNAIVENRGCRVGLLLLGFTPEKELPPCEMAILPGVMDIQGVELEPLDLDKTRAAIESMRDKVDAVAVSGFFSVRNPEHENTVKAMVREILGLPTVAAHELSTVLGMQERTVTAVLNARLISVIDELMTATKNALKERNIDAPIMIVKGDGSLMNESVARERPIETILSGPAASIIGATFLNHSENGLVLDMGGTTTDIAILKDGRPRLDIEGAKVGGWRTRVAAAEANTFGLGGDSRIYQPQKAKNLQVGPRRSWPVSVIARDYPQYLAELREIWEHNVGLVINEPCEGYFLLRDPEPHMELTNTQRQVIHVLKEEGPHTVAKLGKILNINPNFVLVEPLVNHGILGTVGFTPTDVLHIEGKYEVGDRDAALLAAALMARQRDMDTDELVDTAKDLITEKMCRVILDSILEYEKAGISPFYEDDHHHDETMEFFFRNSVWNQKAGLLANRFQLQMPIIGIGAPVHAWLPEAAKRFYTEAVFPPHNDVANAVGAAAGKVMTIYRVLVQNHEANGIAIYAPWGRIKYEPSTDTIGEGECQVLDNTNLMILAAKDAIAEGKKRIAQEMQEQGISDYEILVEKEEVRTGKDPSALIKLHIETKIEIIAVGHPQWSEKKGK